MTQQKQKNIGLVILVIVFALIIMVSISSNQNQTKRIEYEQEALQLIKEGKFDDAAIVLISYYPSNKEDLENMENINSIVLYNYAHAKSSEAENDISMANHYINGDEKFTIAFEQYKGELKEEINEFIKEITTKNEKFTEEQKIKDNREKQQYEATRHLRGVKIGMTADEVLKSNWGKPNHINRTTTAYGTEEQWVYSGGYLYFDDYELGIMVLKTIQN